MKPRCKGPGCMAAPYRDRFLFSRVASTPPRLSRPGLRPRKLHVCSAICRHTLNRTMCCLVPNGDICAATNRGLLDHLSAKFAEGAPRPLKKKVP
jgi:hypothetical protein